MRSSPVEAMIGAVTSDAYRRKRETRARLVSAFLKDCENARMLRRHRMGRKADQVLERARSRTFVQLERRWGKAKVLKRAHVILRFLDKLEREPQAELFGDSFRVESR